MVRVVRVYCSHRVPQLTIAKSPVAPVCGFAYAVTSAGVMVDVAHAPFLFTDWYGGDVSIAAARTLAHS